MNIRRRDATGRLGHFYYSVVLHCRHSLSYARADEAAQLHSPLLPVGVPFPVKPAKVGRFDFHDPGALDHSPIVQVRPSTAVSLHQGRGPAGHVPYQYVKGHRVQRQRSRRMLLIGAIEPEIAEMDAVGALRALQRAVKTLLVSYHKVIIFL
jgi:hypothetical protein